MNLSQLVRELCSDDPNQGDEIEDTELNRVSINILNIEAYLDSLPCDVRWSDTNLLKDLVDLIRYRDILLREYN